MRAGFSCIFLWLSCWSALATNNAAPISQSSPSASLIAPPPSYVVNASNQFPDGSWACVHASNVKPQDQCKPHCGDLTNHTVICPGLFYPDGPNKGQPISMPGSGSNDVRTLGKCQCDVPLLDEVYYTVALALPDIAAIGCELLIGTFETVLQAGLSAFPPTRAMDAGIMAGLSAVDEISNKLSNSGQVSDSFMKWFDDPCPHSKFTGKMDEIFNGLIGIAGARGMRTGPGRPRGDPRGNPEGNPRDGNSRPSNIGRPVDTVKPTAEPSAAPSTTQAPKTTKPPSATSDGHSRTTDSACALHKRDSGKPGHWKGECDPGPNNHMTIHSTEAVWVEFGKQETLITKTCDGAAWPQACYHYQSAMNRPDKNWKTLRCEDFQGAPAAKDWAPNRVMPRKWDNEHDGNKKVANYQKKKHWRDPEFRALKGEQGDCHVDEYPPLYWYNKDPKSPEIKNKEQAVRLLPGNQNREAAVLWTGFCWDNALAPDGKQIANKDVKSVGKAEIRKEFSDGKKTTTIISAITVTVDKRPVFTMETNFGANPPNEGLDKNPCHPSALVDKDFGFCLDKDDPWYDKNKVKHQYTYWDTLPEDYPNLLQVAEKRLPKKVDKRAAGSDMSPIDFTNVTFTA